MSRSRTLLRRRAAHRGRRGFTLLEVVVVVTIIALLATLVAPRVIQHVGRSKQKIAQAKVAFLAEQVSLYMLDNNLSHVPDDFDLVVLAEGDDPYVRMKDLKDPWENDYTIRVGIDAVNPDFDIVSYGADGQPGGEGEEQDVVN